MKHVVFFVLVLIVAIKLCNGQTPTPKSSRTVARLILADSLSSSDDPTTLALLDSVVSDKKKIRDHYFPVFQKIAGEADGALAEALGSYVLQYVKQYPNELAERYSCCSNKGVCCESMLRLASLAGYEIMMRADNQKEYSDLLDQMTSNYKNWKADRLLSTFIDRVETVRREWKN